MSCTCETYEVRGPGEKTLTGVSRLDPDCRKHGLHEPERATYEWRYWPANHPLRRHAGMVLDNPPDVVIHGTTVRRRPEWRLERPRETEARLLREAELGIPIPPLQRLPELGFRACPPRFGQR